METLASVEGKKIVLISHDLSQTGSPLLLVETAVRLRKAGASVQLVTLASDAREDNLAARHGIQVLPRAASFAQCARADVVIANTAETADWITRYLREYPQSGQSLLWWIHEMRARDYTQRISSLGDVRAVVFDSQASLNAWAATGLNFPPVARVIHPCVDDILLETAAHSRFRYHRTDLVPWLPFRAARYAYRMTGMSRWLPLGAGTHQRVSIRRKLGIAPDDFAVTLIGVNDPRKGHALLASTVGRILSQDPTVPVKLILVGFSDIPHKVRFARGVDAATRRALDTRRLVTAVRDLAPYYAASDALVMNSQAPGENFGRVTIEAMTFKLPVLGTDAGGTPEIVQDGVTGLLHAVGVPGQEQLAENIRTLARSRRRAIAMGEAGYRRVLEKFTRTRFDAEFAAVLSTAERG
jgi:glycosyltransferase involved in cell wall biosynthesis